MKNVTRDERSSGSHSNPAIEFFDKTAQEYSEKYSSETLEGYVLRSRKSKVLNLFDKPGGRVLDVGCGPGAMIQELSRLGCEFWGVDASPKMLKLAQDHAGECQNTHFLLGQATSLALPSNVFDAVLCMGVMDRIPRGDEAIREMLRVLKPDGTLIVTFANLRSPIAWWKKYVFLPLVAQTRRIFVTGHQPSLAPFARQAQHYTRRGVKSLFSTQGATVVEAVGYYFNLFLPPLDELWPSAALWLMRKFEEGWWSCPAWAAAGFIVKAKKDCHVDTIRSNDP